MQSEIGLFSAKQVHEFIMNALDDLLTGFNTLENFHADGFLLDVSYESANSLIVYVSFQESETHFTKSVFNVFGR